MARALERGGVDIEGLAVATRRGRITLRGTVAGGTARERALEIIRAVDGVRRVDDRLSIVERAENQKDRPEIENIYITQAGDTLECIANKMLGDRLRWLELRELNRGAVNEPHVLAPGLILRLPEP